MYKERLGPNGRFRMEGDTRMCLLFSVLTQGRTTLAVKLVSS